jgi:hydrogenase-4 component F
VTAAELALALVAAPLLGAAFAATVARARASVVLLAAAVVSCGLAIALAAIATDGALLLGGLVRVDPLGRVIIAVTGAIFLGIATYVWHRGLSTPELRPQLPRISALALVFVAAAFAVALANHLLAMWLAIEATTIAATPMIVRPDHPASRRASWRYLLFSAAGLGLVLLGLGCLERGLDAAGGQPSLFLDELLHRAATGHPLPANPWTQLGGTIIVLGLGTKLGLAPMYGWMPQAYDEAPPAVAALLGAIQFNVALLMLIRVVAVFRPLGLVEGELITMGVASMAVSTASIIATRNMKRLIAYASINHAGVIAIGLGVGRPAAYGLLLYVLSNAFIKAILLLTAGKIKAHYRTKDTRAIRGLIKDLPYSGLFLMVGTFALLGFPPFGSFLGELLILSALVSSGQLLVFAAFCSLITMTFVATGRTVFPMIWGQPTEERRWPRQTLISVLPKLAFLAALLVLGVYIPPALGDVLAQAAALLGGPAR